MADGRHGAPRGRRRQAGWFGHGRTRALLSLGIIFGFGAVGTMAYWTDQGTMTTGDISAGTLDLRLNNASTLVGEGGTWNNSAFTASSLIPGESVAFSFLVRNDGDAGFRSATATASGTLATGLRFTTTYGATGASNSGCAQWQPRRFVRSQHCWLKPVTLSASAARDQHTRRHRSLGVIDHGLRHRYLLFDGRQRAAKCHRTASYVLNAAQLP